MHGFLSRDGMPPAELLAAGRDEVTALRRRARRRTGWSRSSAGFTLPPRRAARGLKRGGSWSRPAPRRAARHPRRPRALGPRLPALPVLPRLGGARPAARRPRHRRRLRRARAAPPAVVGRRRLLRPHDDRHRGGARAARRPRHRGRRRASRGSSSTTTASTGVRARRRSQRPAGRGLRPARASCRTQTACSQRSAASSTTAGFVRRRRRRPDQRPRRLGGRQRRQPTRPGDHRRRRRIRRRHRHQRRPRRGGHSNAVQRAARPPTRTEGVAMTHRTRRPACADPTAEQASARADDLALRLPDADRHQPGLRRLARNDVAGARAPSSSPRSPCRS